MNCLPSNYLKKCRKKRGISIKIRHLENSDMHRARQTSFSFLSKEQIAVCPNKNNELHLRIIRYFIINSFFSSPVSQIRCDWVLGLLITTSLHSTSKQRGWIRQVSSLLGLAFNFCIELKIPQSGASVLPCIPCSQLQVTVLSPSLSPPSLPLPCAQCWFYSCSSAPIPIFQPPGNYYKGQLPRMQQL